MFLLCIRKLSSLVIKVINCFEVKFLVIKVINCFEVKFLVIRVINCFEVKFLVIKVINCFEVKFLVIKMINCFEVKFLVIRVINCFEVKFLVIGVINCFEVKFLVIRVINCFEVKFVVIKVINCFEVKFLVHLDKLPSLGIRRLLSVVCKLFTFQASSPKPLGRLELNLAGMLLGWSSTKLLFFVPVGYTIWLPGPIICSDWLKFQRSSSLKLMNRLNPNCK